MNQTDYEYSHSELVFMNFYIADRNRTTFQTEEEVPLYLHLMVPYWMMSIILEYGLVYLKTGKSERWNDGVTSIATGTIMDITKLFTGAMELAGYQWLYQYRIFDLDWQSPVTWWVAALGVDLGYYWLHRLAHEISLFWCGHQVHHSSEDYNYFTALRQSAFQHMFTLGNYQPLALLGVSLPALLVHINLNLLFQVWLHSELIPKLGPIEWIFNTASHHRVHHGANKYCLDKNYAGFLIIWDRMFGTFEVERTDEKITFGLVDQPQTFNPIYLQLFYFRDLYYKAMSMKTWGDSWKALFYGPGWTPGSPRLGDMSTMPEGQPIRKKWDPQIPTWVTGYLISHFALISYFQQQILFENFSSYSLAAQIASAAYIFYSLFVFGCMFDGYWLGTLLEAIRCIGTVVILRQEWFSISPMVDSIIITYFAISTLIWCSQSLSIINDMRSGNKKNLRKQN